MRHHDQLAAHVADAIDEVGLEYRACADQNVLRHRLCQNLDAPERLGGIQRHLDDAKSSLDKGVPHGFGVRGLKTPKDRYQRKASHKISQQRNILGSLRYRRRQQSIPSLVNPFGAIYLAAGRKVSTLPNGLKSRGFA
jgi:hypothetical protein